jgi:hypothetical protein
MDNEAARNMTYEVLCDVIELKKVNNGLMKATLIDDLLGDTYAKLYEEIGLDALTDIVLPSEEGTATTAQVPPKPMALTNVMNIDGAVDSSAPSRPASTDPVPASRARKTGVGRREIQRKAEAAANRPVIATSTETKATNSAPGPVRSTSTTSVSTPAAVLASQDPTVQVVIPSPGPKAIGMPGTLPRRTSSINVPSSSVLTGTPLPANALAPAPSPAPTQKMPITTRAVDSDDESELTELDDEPEEPPAQVLRAFGAGGGLFPTVGGKPKLDDASVGSWTTAREGEEESGGEDESDEEGEDEGGNDDREAEEGDGDETPEDNEDDADARDEDGYEKMDDK